MARAANRICGFLPLLLLFTFPLTSAAQEADTLVAPDTFALPAAAAVTTFKFKPNSTRAVLFAIVPGMGQVYNRKYWKLPLVYGGFMGFMYAVTWNAKNYQDYGAAYKSILADAAAYNQLLNEADGSEVDYAFNKAWTDLVSTTDYPSVVNSSAYHNLFKSRKDYFRRNRDLSLILTACFYLITMVDAYVDAELFDFDISPDLSLRITPALSPQTPAAARHIGLNCSIAF